MKGENKMANIKSAKKRVLIAEANRQRNVAFKSAIKTAIKKIETMADKKIHRKPTTLKKGWLEILNTMLNKKWMK